MGIVHTELLHFSPIDSLELVTYTNESVTI